MGVVARTAVWRKKRELIVCRQDEARQDASEDIVDVVGWLQGLISGRETERPVLEGLLRGVTWLHLGGNAKKECVARPKHENRRPSGRLFSCPQTFFFRTPS